MWLTTNYPFVVIALGSFLLGVVFILVFRKIAIKNNILIPDKMPLVGGIGMGLSFILVSAFSFSGLPAKITGILAASGLMLIFGVIDDWRELSVSKKFFVQLIATSLLILFGVRTNIVYIGNLINIIITFIWILAITNAFNHLDVTDGLAAGCALIAALAFFMVALINADMNMAILCLALSGAILSCFLFNLPPARIYMGNSGSHFLGFVLAAIALAISYAPLERKIALLTPFLILGFPIFDTGFLMLMRLRQGRRVFKKSNDHIALRLLKLGYSNKKVLAFGLILALFFSLSGILLSQAPNLWGIAIILVAGLVSVALISWLKGIAVD